MMEAERLQMLEEPVAQVVHHPLPGVDLHLRSVRGNDLIHDLEQHAGDDDRHQKNDLAVRSGPRRPGGD